MAKNKFSKDPLKDIYTGKNEAGKVYTARRKRNIDGYGEEEIRENLQKIKQQQKAEEEKKRREEEKARRVPFLQFNKLILASYVLLVLGMIVSVAFGEYLYVPYCIITILMSIFINRRLKFNDINMELINVLLWNLTNSMKDFIRYQISQKLLDKYKENTTKVFIVFMVLLVLFQSNNIVFIIGLMAMISQLLVCFANQDLEFIHEKITYLIIMTVLGFFVKIFIPLFFTRTFYLDFGFLVLLNLLVALDFFTKNIQIHKPLIHD